MTTLFNSPSLTDHFTELYPQTPGVYIFVSEHKRGKYKKAKIGVTEHLPIRHHKKELESGDTLTIWHFIPCEDMEHARGLEAILHDEYKYQCTRGEWFWLHIEDLRLLAQCNDQFTWWRSLYREGEIQRVRALKSYGRKEERA